MTADMTIRANKRARGEILTLLHSVHPMPAEVRTIANALIESGMNNTPDIAAYIDYLVGKGYIIIIDPDSEAQQRLRGVCDTSAFIKLSPHGVDLIEGTVEDPGVDV